ncbi:hypothetical protein C7443_102241 [Plasticicumulans acidivorans]|uniref:Integrase-like protein n=2 Tax=Plasticicumulans acidivorans TaxID=886464 RepID=A0A317MYT5_9GAMM|nr:hypothetical protein C7443_102241 [Plasticicumulans acidivorans]
MVERFNGCIAEVLATTRFHSGEHLRETLTRYVQVYNLHISQRALAHCSPVVVLKRWYQEHPELFQQQPQDQAGLDM